MIDLPNLKKNIGIIEIEKRRNETEKVFLPGNLRPPGKNDLDVNRQNALDPCHIFASACNSFLFINKRK